jgi:CheY-like chemotaxis protein
MGDTTNIRGRRVLVVEDDALVAMLLDSMLSDLDCEVVGPFSTLSAALAFLEGDAVTAAPADVAVLDLNLDGEPSYPVADALRARGVPLIFCTGYGDADLRTADAGTPLLNKPYRASDLAAVLATVLAPA